MKLIYRSRLPHPLYPGLAITHALRARKTVPALSGTVHELLEAAARGVHAQRAVFTLHHTHTPFLQERDRQTLWETFAVPAYAVLLDAAGEIAGYECEAQTGLHFRLERPELSYLSSVFVDSTGHYIPLDATVDDTLCECGRPGHRITAATRPEALLVGDDSCIIGYENLLQLRIRIAPAKREQRVAHARVEGRSVAS